MERQQLLRAPAAGQGGVPLTVPFHDAKGVRMRLPVLALLLATAATSLHAQERVPAGSAVPPSTVENSRGRPIGFAQSAAAQGVRCHGEPALRSPSGTPELLHEGVDIGRRAFDDGQAIHGKSFPAMSLSECRRVVQKATGA